MPPYQTLIADPPWRYRAPLKMKDGVRRASSAHYRTMDLEGVQRFLGTTPVSTIHRVLRREAPAGMLADAIADTAHLWLWVTNPFLIDGSASAIAESWGFAPKALCTWVKGRIEAERLVLRVGMGSYLRGCTEHLLFCTRGQGTSLVQSGSVPNVFIAPRGRHSEKPAAAFDLIRRVSPGPYLSLFERALRPGFDVVGDEISQVEEVLT